MDLGEQRDTGAFALQTDPDTGEYILRDLDSSPMMAQGSALLVVKRGALEGIRFPLDITTGQATTLGRAPESTIFLDDVTVSRKHAVVIFRDGRWHITDAGSLNGTYVNRERVETSNLTDQDEVQVGKYRFIFLEVKAD